MAEQIKTDNPDGVDSSLVAMFLRMSVEHRLQANDNAVRAILELRDAFRKSETEKRESERNP